MSEFVENTEVNENEEIVEETLESDTVEESISEVEDKENIDSSQEIEEHAEVAQDANNEEISNEGNNDETPMVTMEDALDSVKEIKVGDTVKGDVLAFDESNQVRVSIQDSGGLEGVIPRNELSATPFEEITEIVNIGDEIELVVIKPIKDKENGNFLLSKKRIDAKKVWNELQVKFDNNEVIEAPVKSVVKGGLVVDAGVRGFVPASMVEDHFVEDFTPYVDQTLKFVIVEIEPSENRLILSHKEIARKESEEKRAQRLQELEEGSIIEGIVARLVNFGAFIDLDGVDGLVHISRIAHEHVEKPSDILTPGDTVSVKVLSVDLEEGRVSLSIKDTLEGPWDNIEEKAPEGAILDGIVKRLTGFGAFVEVFPGVEGLVHISQISHEHIATPHEKLEEGQNIKVKVLSVNPDENRLSLSIKALLDRPVQVEDKESNASERSYENKSKKPRRQNQQRNTAQSEEPETGFSLGDILGNALDSFKTDEE